MLKAIFRHIALAAVLCAGLGCSGNEDTAVPEGVLRIFAEGSTTIAANGTETVAFRVMFGSQDVSSSPEMNLYRSFEGEDRRLGAGVNEFSTNTPGTYTITARYYDGAEAHYTDNEIVVTAFPASGEETSDWQQKVFAIEFTSTTCIGCPDLVTALHAIEAERPGVLCPVAFHMDYQGPDPMTVTQSAQFASEFMGTNIALPALFFNMHQPFGQSMTNVKALIEAELDRELKSYVPSCGVAVSSSYDGNSRRASVSVKVKSNEQQRCRVAVFIVEDDIIAAQLDDPDFEHDNVVRTVLSTGIYGDYVNDHISLYPGTEYGTEYSCTILDAWKPENMRVVAAVLVPDEDGRSFVSDNVNECRLADGNSDYLTK